MSVRVTGRDISLQSLTRTFVRYAFVNADLKHANEFHKVNLAYSHDNDVTCVHLFNQETKRKP